MSETEAEFENCEIADTLPNKLFELIDVALNDLEKVEKDPDYRIEMMRWHSRDETGACCVCFAGAVMAMTLGANIEKDELEMNFCQELWDKFDALNYVRNGLVLSACDYLGVTGPILEEVGVFEREIQPVVTYAENPTEFKVAMRKIQAFASRLYI